MKAIERAVEKARRFLSQDASVEDLERRLQEVRTELREAEKFARSLQGPYERPSRRLGEILESGDAKAIAEVRGLDERIRELKGRDAAISSALKERKAAAALEAARGMAARLPIRETAQAVLDAHTALRRKSAELQRLTSELASAQRRHGGEITGYVPASAHGLVRQAARLSARPTVSSSELAPPSWGELKRAPPQKGPEVLELVGAGGSTWIRRHPDGREEVLEGPPPGTPKIVGGRPLGIGEVR